MSKIIMNPERPVLLAELRDLKKAERTVKRDLAETERLFKRQMSDVKSARRNVSNALGRIAKRRAIINGRLAAK